MVLRTYYLLFFRLFLIDPTVVFPCLPLTGIPILRMVLIFVLPWILAIFLRSFPESSESPLQRTTFVFLLPRLLELESAIRAASRLAGANG